MSDDLPEQFILQRAAQSDIYHTGDCIGYARAESEPTRVSDRTIDWHGLSLCRYCDPDVAVENQRGGVADD